jgi:CHAD domain-containing protein
MYKFRNDASSIAGAFREIALSQIDLALQDVDTAPEAGSAVHAARRRCKKLRGLLRLVRPVFPDYRKENRAIREAAEGLSAARDAEVLVETFDSHIGKDAGDRPVYRDVRRRLVEHGEAFGSTRNTELLSSFRAAMQAARLRAGSWSLEKDGFGALKGGLRATYRDARQNMAQAAETGEAADFHRWRKAVKYHGYHLALLRDLAPDLLAAHRQVADLLGETLGEQHNLAVLLEVLEQSPDRFGAHEELSAIEAAVRDRMQGMEAKAFSLGRQLFSEEPAALVRRFRGFWRTWR